MFGLQIGNLKDILTRNPLKYGDALGLTHGPLSGHMPGKLTGRGLDWQAKVNPGIDRRYLEKSNDLAPYVAAAIATFGGSAAGEAGGSALEGGGEAAGGTGAFDMFGSQSSPTDAATVFDEGGNGATAGPNWMDRVRQMRPSFGGGQQRPPQQADQYQVPDEAPIQPNSYAQHAMQQSQQADPEMQYWLSRADRLRSLAGHVTSQLYGNA